MLVQYYDRGSPSGKKLFADLQDICQAYQITPDPEYIQDMSRVYSMGIQGKSVLLINNQAALVDKYPSKADLEKLIQDYLEDEY